MRRSILTRPRTLLTVIGVASAGVLVFDAITPVGMEGGLLYTPILVLTWWLPYRRAAYVAAVPFSALIILGFLLSPPGAPASIGIFNRIVSLIVLWVVAGLCERWKRTMKDRQRLFEHVRAGRERLQALSRQLLTAQETERRHLARELHDEIGQALTAVKIAIESAQRLRDPAIANRLLEEGIKTLDRTLDEIRDLCLDLRPSLLDDLGLITALRWLLERQSRLGGFSEKLIAEPADLRLPQDLELVCFRVVQEAVTNIIRHAEAEHVVVEVRAERDAVDVLVRDDGIGFDVQTALAQAAQGRSLGLLGLQERARLVGGDLDIQSARACGTTIRARFPMGDAVPAGKERRSP